MWAEGVLAHVGEQIFMYPVGRLLNRYDHKYGMSELINSSHLVDLLLYFCPGWEMH